MKIWDIASGALLKTLGHDCEGGVNCGIRYFQFSRDGRRILTACRDGTARTWDVDAGTVLSELTTPYDGVSSARFLSDEKKVLTSSWSGEVALWDLATSEQERFWKTGGPVYILAVSPDERWAITCDSSRSIAQLWSIDTGEPGPQLNHDEGHAVSAIAYSNDGQRIATGTVTGRAFVWDAAMPEAPLFELIGNSGSIRTIEFSGDGKKIVTSCFHEAARVWDAETGGFLYSFKGHDSGISSAAFSRDPQGSHLATGGNYDMTLKVWETKELHNPHVLEWLTGHNKVVFLPDESLAPGRLIVTAGTAQNSALISDSLSRKTITKSSANRINFARPSRRGQTTSSNQTSSTVCR